VDEAGRGPLAGPVVAAAVILDPSRPISGLADSKILSARKRTQLAAQIRKQSLAWFVAEASVEEIDHLNILHATMLAMKRAVAGLKLPPSLVLVDGNRLPDIHWPARAIVGGDATEPAISAASILAKTWRDGLLDDLHALHPEYGFDRHRGYPTRAHFQALEKFGVLPEHRRTFAPVRAILERIV
jgi:ribonuclease HII